jgi:hypothetical protein
MPVHEEMWTFKPGEQLRKTGGLVGRADQSAVLLNDDHAQESLPDIPLPAGGGQTARVPAANGAKHAPIASNVGRSEHAAPKPAPKPASFAPRPTPEGAARFKQHPKLKLGLGSSSAGTVNSSSSSSSSRRRSEVHNAILDGDPSSSLKPTHTVDRASIRRGVQHQLLSFKPAMNLRDPATGQTAAQRVQSEIKRASPERLRPTAGPKASVSGLRGSMQKELLRFDPAKLRDAGSGISSRDQLNSEIETMHVAWPQAA